MQRAGRSFSLSQASALAHSMLDLVLDLVLATGVHWKRRVGGGLKASRGQGILRTAVGLPRTARTAGVCLGPPPHSSAMVLAVASC